jgi:hypothetical protein
VESSRVLGTPRYQVIDASRAAAARSRLGAVVQSAGTPAAGAPAAGAPAAGTPAAGTPAAGAPAAGAPADLAPVALAGLARAIGLGDVLYPGREGRASRARMAQIARQQVISQATAGQGTESGRVPPAGLEAGPAAGDAAGELVRESAAGGGPGPPSLLAMEEVIAATVHALTAVLEDGAVVTSDVVGTRVGGIHIPGAHGAAGHGGQG